MKAAKLRLLVAAVLFGAWLGWLVYLVVVSRAPVIVSRPQFLVSDLVVTAQVEGDEEKPHGQVKITQVLWGARPASNDIDVSHLSDCGPKQGWNGPGSYLLLLKLKKTGPELEITEIPMSPGFAPKKKPEQYRMYRATADALRQAGEMIQAKP